MRLACYPNRFPFRLVLSPCCQSCLQRTVEEHETLTSVCLFTRPRRPTGRTNREPSLKPAKRNNHNVSLEEKKNKKKKDTRISCCLLCLSQLSFNWMCFFCDESPAFLSVVRWPSLWSTVSELHDESQRTSAGMTWRKQTMVIYFHPFAGFPEKCLINEETKDFPGL